MFEYLKNKRILSVIVLVVLAFISVVSFVAYNSLFGASQAQAEPEQFTMPLGSGDFKELSALLKEKGFIPTCLGRRILRTETAGPALLSILQYEWGDIG